MYSQVFYTLSSAKLICPYTGSALAHGMHIRPMWIEKLQKKFHAIAFPHTLLQNFSVKISACTLLVWYLVFRFHEENICSMFLRAFFNNLCDHSLLILIFVMEWTQRSPALREQNQHSITCSEKSRMCLSWMWRYVYCNPCCMPWLVA